MYGLLVIPQKRVCMAVHVHDIAMLIPGRHDGCATFYRCGKFDKVATRTIEFDELSKDLISADVSDNVPDFATHNVALVTVLRPKGRWAPVFRLCACLSFVRALVKILNAKDTHCWGFHPCLHISSVC